MLLKFYSLREQPFGETPDPRYLFWSSSHREAWASLYCGIECGCGFVTLIAPPGTGKTTLLFHLLDRLRASARTAYLFQTQCSSQDFLRYLIADLGCDATEQDTVALHAKLNEIMATEARLGRRLVLVIDEAQNLDRPVLEAIRLLSNFQTPSQKLIQIVLAGQPELAMKLSLAEMLQLRQRVSMATRLEPLTTAEVRGFIDHRMRVAGNRGHHLPFTEAAVALIASDSGGIPRRINTLCFNALALGFAQRRKRIDVSIVEEVISDQSATGFSFYRPVPSKRDISDTRVAASIVLVVLASSLSFSQRAAPSAVPPPVQAPALTSANYLTVTVGENDSLGQLSKKYLGRNLDPCLTNEILKLNPTIQNPNMIRSGTTLCFPLVETPTGAPNSPP